MRDILVEHIDVECPISHAVQESVFYTRWRTVVSLVEKKLLQYDRPSFPRTTRLTEKGREVLARELGNLADLLMRAGYEVILRHEAELNEKLSRIAHAPPPCEYLPNPLMRSPVAAGPTVERSAVTTTQTGR